MQGDSVQITLKTIPAERAHQNLGQSIPTEDILTEAYLLQTDGTLSLLE